MKKYLIVIISIFCIIAFATIILFITKVNQRGEEMEIMVSEGIEGFLDNGLKYIFYDEPFDFNRFRRERSFTLQTEIEGTVIAETASDAVRLGIQYIPGFNEFEPWGVNVFYCLSTDNWVLMRFIRGNYILTGVPGILTINRTDGSMAMHNFRLR